MVSFILILRKFQGLMGFFTNYRRYILRRPILSNARPRLRKSSPLLLKGIQVVFLLFYSDPGALFPAVWVEIKETTLLFAG